MQKTRIESFIMFLLKKDNVFKQKPLSELGLEPWDTSLTPSYLKQKFYCF